MPEPFTAALAGVTSVCATVNGAYFAAYLRGATRFRRRLAAATLAVLYWGIALQCAALLLAGVPLLPYLEPALPSMGRVLTAAGTLSVTVVITRRAFRR
jgi:hypothetical protein